MSWYKIAKLVLDFLSYDSYGNFNVSINGKKYTYYNVSPFFAEKYKWMIENSPRSHGKVLEGLKKFRDTEKHNQLNPPVDDTNEEKQQMLEELYDKGYLK
jgi:hypothetical protein